MFAQIFNFLKTLIRRTLEDECPGMAAEMAYHLMLALFPTLIFVFTLFGLIGDAQQLFPQIMSYLYRMTPPSVAELLRVTLQEIFRGSSGQLALFSFLGAFWAATNGAFVIMRGLNRAYDIPREKQHFIRQRIKAIWVVVALVFFLLIGANMLVFGNMLLRWVEQELLLADQWIALLSWVRWLLVVTGVTLVVAVVYAFIPHAEHRRIHWTTTLPGGMVFLGLWYGISRGFAFYVENLARTVSMAG